MRPFASPLAVVAVAAVAVFVVAAFDARDAAADELADARARAATSFHRGQAAYARHDYSEAGEAFDLAAGFDPNPVPLLDAADAWALAGEPVRAAEDCDRALAMPGITDAQRHFATKQLESLRSAVATIDVPAPGLAGGTGGAAGGLLVEVDGSAAVPTPVHRRVAPGRHQVRMREAHGDRRDVQDIAVRGGETATVEPHLQTGTAMASTLPPFTPATPRAPAKQPVPSEPSAAHGGKPVPTATWIALGVGAAALVPFTIFGVLTVQDSNDFHPTSITSQTTMASTFHRNEALTDVFLGLAGAGVVTGGLVWLLAPSSTVTVGQGVSFERRF